MKKLFVSLLSLLLLLTLVGCGSKKEIEEPIKEDLPKQEEVIEEVNEEPVIEETIEIEEDIDILPVKDVTTMSFWVVFYDQYGNELQRTIEKYGTIPEYKNDLPSGFEKWVYKNTKQDVGNTFKSITTNTYFEAVCHEVKSKSNNHYTPNTDNWPSKGEIIYLDDKPYRVLNKNGSQVKLLGMYDLPPIDYNSSSQTTTEFGKEGQKYVDSVLDKYLNGDETGDFYHSLPDAIKNAIIPQEVTQTMLKFISDGDPKDTGINIQNNWNSYFNFTYFGSATIGSRNVFSMGIEDIFDYYNDDNTVTSDEIILLFLNSTDHSENKHLRLSSVDWEDSNYVCSISRYRGTVAFRPCDDINYTHEPRPVFVIDLAADGVEYSTSAPSSR